MFVIGEILTGLSIGASLWEGISSAGDQREQANAQKESILREMKLLREQKDQLRSQYGIKRGYVTDQYGNRVETLLDKVSQQMLQTREATRDSVARSGLSYSGTIERKKDISTRALRNVNQIGQKGLHLDFESSMFDIATAETRDIGQLDIQLSQLEGQYKAADAASREKFLGLF